MEEIWNNENLTTLMKVTVAFPDLIGIPFLAIAIHGMYLGIEIQHPIYSILIVNLIVPFSVTLAGVAAIFFLKVNPESDISYVINAW